MGIVGELRKRPLVRQWTGKETARYKDSIQTMNTVRHGPKMYE